MALRPRIAFEPARALTGSRKKGGRRRDVTFTQQRSKKSPTKARGGNVATAFMNAVGRNKGNR